MQPEKVIIGSLPRSGSAWLTAMLNSYEESLFLHEASLRHENPFSWLEDSGYQTIGIVGTDAMLPQFSKEKAKRIYLYRDKNEIAKSLQGFLGIGEIDSQEVADECVALAEGWCERFEPFVISYRQLFERESMEKLWRYIFDDCLCVDKYQAMVTLNIQVKKPSKELIDVLCLT